MIGDGGRRKAARGKEKRERAGAERWGRSGRGTGAKTRKRRATSYWTRPACARFRRISRLPHQGGRGNGYASAFTAEPFGAAGLSDSSTAWLNSATMWSSGFFVSNVTTIIAMADAATPGTIS